jgi:hypothetical protein
MQLTPAQITEVYEEIGTMRVVLDPDPNKGLQYVKERLTLCRAMQDRLGELLLKCSRALSDVLTEEIVVSAEIQLGGDVTTLRRRLSGIKQLKESHSTLFKMLKLQYTLLSRTSMDIRLLADLTKEQIKLGDIDPKDGGLVEEIQPGDLSPVDVVDLAPVEPTVDELPANESVTLGPPSAIIEEMNAVLDAPQAPIPEPPATEPVTSLDELFGALHGKHSG